MYRHINVCASSQRMKTIHIPKSMMSAPLLQHPGLTAGQRRYLYSIANVYSTEHMRWQMKQHYLNVLHTCAHSGGENSWVTHAVETRTKPQGQRKCSSSSSTANSIVIFPKIDNRGAM
uniref:Family with sequence similarity 216 member B n=1 Tax=Mastacembelus armatus TaxID=205130 RepID=A0A3Q3ST73_9TELE